tara:strand:- start:1416 stop:1604 length:189 start_codon:yes stop_codon:yes gene_type:complete
MINIEDHKIFIESHKMEMVPYSIAIKALTELSAELSGDGYLEELDKAMQDLRTSISNIEIDE